MLKNMLKKTKTRELVKNLLESSKEPLSANEIFATLKDENITLSSVYRTLDTFYKNNLISKTQSTDGSNKYSIVADNHKHFLECRKCHKSTTIDCPYDKVNAKIKNTNDFVVDEHNLIIYGICKDCNKN